MRFVRFEPGRNSEPAFESKRQPYNKGASALPRLLAAYTSTGVKNATDVSRFNKAVTIEMPSSVVLKVADAPEGVRGDSANNVQKPAKLETGKTINVPLFIKEGELIKVSTADGSYLGRA